MPNPIPAAINRHRYKRTTIWPCSLFGEFQQEISADSMLQDIFSARIAPVQGNIPLPQDPQGAPNHTKLSDLISKVPAGPSSSQRSKGQTLTAVLSRHCRAFRDKGDVHTCVKKSCSGGQAHVQQGYNPGADGHLKPQCFVLRAGHASFTLPFP